MVIVKLFTHHTISTLHLLLRICTHIVFKYDNSICVCNKNRSIDIDRMSSILEFIKFIAKYNENALVKDRSSVLHIIHEEKTVGILSLQNMYNKYDTLIIKNKKKKNESKCCC